MELTHLDPNNNPKMVDISDKDSTHREAIAKGKITMSKEAFMTILKNKSKKGPVLQTAIIAAIMGAKKTPELIPMCHSLHLTSVQCTITDLKEESAFILEVKAKSKGQTGVEMEALMGVSIGLLTIYDMIKAIDKNIVLSQIHLLQKHGGKSGSWSTHLE